MLDQKAMIKELKKINKFLLNSAMKDKKETNFSKLYSLRHNSIINRISYIDIDSIPPIFSERAIEILEVFYRNNSNVNIDTIIKNLQEYLFREEKFYIYFYWFFINKSQNAENIDENYKVITYSDEITKKILDSMNKDALEMFSNITIEYFERGNQWLTPFLYYYETLLNNKPPIWLQNKYILKLVTFPYIQKIGNSVDINLNWLINKFPTITSYQIVEYGLKVIENVKTDISRTQIIQYFIDYYNSNAQDILTDKILTFIVNTTKKMFELSLNHKLAEFSDIGYFWRKCNSNYIELLFSKFTVKMILSAMKIEKDDINSQYRKEVLSYCTKIATISQKVKIIREIEDDLVNKSLSDEEKEEIHGFLATLGREKSVKLIINSYLNDKAIRSNYNKYALGFIRPNCSIMKDFINLFIYSTEKSNERRNMLRPIAQEGIKQHLIKENFKIFEKKIYSEIKKSRKLSSWKSEYYSDYLLQMELSIYSI
jgi:hypothetical protein